LLRFSQRAGADVSCSSLIVYNGQQLSAQPTFGGAYEKNTRYEPHAKEEINRRIDSIVHGGRNPVPRQIRFTTWTLRYNQTSWVTVDGLNKHWERARVTAQIAGESVVKVHTENVAALTLWMPANGPRPAD
jgi:hypothetical protein